MFGSVRQGHPSEGEVMSVSVIGVVGAGFMGSGIAESAAAAGLEVVVHEPEQPPLDRSRGAMEKSVRRAVSRGKLEQDDADALLERVVHTTRLDDLAHVDAVIEAISEDPRAKGKLFGELDRLLPD